MVSNKKPFTKRELRNAERARRLQTKLLFSRDRHLERITEVLQECPITSQDVVNAKAIFGPSVGALKGKTTKSKPLLVSVEQISIPGSIRDRLKELHLHDDFCFVNGIGFFVSITDKVKFCTSEAVGNCTEDVIVGALKKIQATYRQGGFRVIIESLDGEFFTARERIREETHMDMNPVMAEEHAPVIDRHISHLKEGVRDMYQMIQLD